MDRSNYRMKKAQTTAKKQSTMKRGLGGSYSQETMENGTLTWVRNGLKESQVKIEEIDQDNPPAEQSDDMKHMEEDGGGAWGDEMGGTQQARLLAEFRANRVPKNHPLQRETPKGYKTPDPNKIRWRSTKTAPNAGRPRTYDASSGFSHYIPPF